MKRALTGAHSPLQRGGSLASSTSPRSPAQAPLLLQRNGPKNRAPPSGSRLASAPGPVRGLSTSLSTTPLLRVQLSSSGLLGAMTRFPGINLHLHLHRHMSSVHARGARARPPCRVRSQARMRSSSDVSSPFLVCAGPSEAAQEMSKKAAGYEAKAAQALTDGNLVRRRRTTHTAHAHAHARIV
jgi:hypothetical protein